jgi:arylsulfatase
MTAARIGRTIKNSVPTPYQTPRPRADAPNVVVIVLDDLGFGQLGCFGSDIETPNIDRLAADGLRYNRFHVTSLCSPTRACLMSGRNHHSVGMGFLTDIPIGFPGYNGRIPKSAATMPRLLRDAGYSTFAVGKWHLAPRWDQSASGPFDLWPLGLGFERYYGFLNGDTNQWTPDLVCDNAFVEPPRSPAEGYHLTEDLADQALRMVTDQHQATPDKPFFLYFAPGAMHAPHHAPEAWIDPYRGRFDAGWEAWRRETFARQLELGVVPGGTTLTERPPWVGDWEALDSGERKLFARMMEVFAGFLTHTDHQIGRVLGGLRELGLIDETLVLLISDNGASAEGGPHGSLNEHRFTHDMLDDLSDTIAHIDDLGGFRAYNHYAWGWAWAGNTPMKLWKRYTWLGGVRTPLIVNWPDRLTDTGTVRPQFCHAIDLMPTVLEAAGVEVPDAVDGVTQQAVDGASLRPTFDDPAAPNQRLTQYFEMMGSRAIYHDGWKATTDHIGSQLSIESELIAGSHDFGDDHWALFDLEADFAEAHDQSTEHPDRAREMVDVWWAEAEHNQVLPLDDSFIGRAIALEPRPYAAHHSQRYQPGGGPVIEDFLPPLGNGFRLTAGVEIDDGGASGVLAALGDWSNGFALYLLDGCLVFSMSLFGDLIRVASPSPVLAGRHELAVVYERIDGGGPVRLSVDGVDVAEGTIGADLPFRWQIGGGSLLIGRDTGFPVCDDYDPPFSFSGTLHRVTVESGGASERLTPEAITAELRHE